ncbi:hypothetical protein QF001_008608 [Paraburkholderia youngii]
MPVAASASDRSRSMTSTGRSCPAPPAEAVGKCGSTPETPGTERHCGDGRGTDRAGPRARRGGAGRSRRASSRPAGPMPCPARHACIATRSSRMRAVCSTLRDWLATRPARRHIVPGPMFVVNTNDITLNDAVGRGYHLQLGADRVIGRRRRRNVGSIRAGVGAFCCSQHGSPRARSDFDGAFFVSSPYRKDVGRGVR